MFSFTRGKPIAIIKGGKNNGKILKLYTNDKLNNEIEPKQKIIKKQIIKKKYDSDDYSSEEKRCDYPGCECINECECHDVDYDDDELPDIIVDNPFDLINEDYLRKKHKKLNTKKISKLHNALKTRRKPIELDDDLSRVYDDSRQKLNEMQKKEFILNDGELIPLPQDDHEMLYCGGPAGSGKSTIAAAYADQFKIKNPRSKIYLYSKKPKDKILDLLKPIRIHVNESMLDEKPDYTKIIEPNSLVIFDDIDTYQPEKLAQAVRNLRDDIIETARDPMKIKCFSTSHQLMNYNKTRDLLNEATTIFFFPKMGSYHIKRMLKEYCGLDKEIIKKILNVPSRWVGYYKTSFPQYIIHSKGGFIIN